MSSATPEKLFYYCSAKEAEDNLADLCLRWISPAQLDGITELNHEAKIEYAQEELTKPFVKLASSLIFSRDEPKGDSALISAIKRWRDAERFSEIDEAEAVLSSLCGKIVEQHIDTLELTNRSWFEACSQTRFLRLFSKFDNFQVWQQFGEGFRGAVFEFQIIENSSLSTPQPLNYINQAPELSNIKEQITNLLHSTRAHPESQIEKKLTIQAPALKSLGEWRSFKKLEHATEDTPEHWPIRLPFDGNELKSVYLGPGINAASRAAIAKAASKLEKAPKILQLQFTNGKFDLSAEQVN